MNRNLRCRFQTTDEHGFSMLEVLLAMVILTVGILGIVGLYIESINARAWALHRQTASAIATEALQTVYMQSYASVDDIVDPIEITRNGMVYRVTQTVRTSGIPMPPTVTATAFKEVVVDVGWSPQGTNREFHETVTTYKAP